MTVSSVSSYGVFQLKSSKQEALEPKKSVPDFPATQPSAKVPPVDASKVDIINHVSREDFVDSGL